MLHVGYGISELMILSADFAQTSGTLRILHIVCSSKYPTKGSNQGQLQLADGISSDFIFIIIRSTNQHAVCAYVDVATLTAQRWALPWMRYPFEVQSTIYSSILKVANRPPWKLTLCFFFRNVHSVIL